MGGRGASIQISKYNPKGGFTEQAYRATGETLAGIKVIEKINSKSASLPEMSNTPGTVYILKSAGHFTAMGIYGADRRLQKAIEFNRRHVIRLKNGKRIVLKKGIAHVHNLRGGRGNNVRYLTIREKKKYGTAIELMGGVLSE